MCRSALRDYTEICFIFFQVVLYFPRTVQGRLSIPRPSTVGLAQWLNGPASPHHPALRACSMRWHGRPGLAHGQGVAQPVGTPQGSDGGCAGHGGAVGFSPKIADGGWVEKRVRHNSVRRRRWSSGGRGGH
jgi:hypothetical protein